MRRRKTSLLAWLGVATRGYFSDTIYMIASGAIGGLFGAAATAPAFGWWEFWGVVVGVILLCVLTSVARAVWGVSDDALGRIKQRRAFNQRRNKVQLRRADTETLIGLDRQCWEYFNVVDEELADAEARAKECERERDALVDLRASVGDYLNEIESEMRRRVQPSWAFQRLADAPLRSLDHERGKDAG